MKRLIIEIDDEIFDEIETSLTEFINEMHTEDVLSQKIIITKE
jgi:hypothetical protein